MDTRYGIWVQKENTEGGFWFDNCGTRYLADTQEEADKFFGEVPELAVGFQYSVMAYDPNFKGHPVTPTAPVTEPAPALSEKQKEVADAQSVAQQVMHGAMALEDETDPGHPSQEGGA